MRLPPTFRAHATGSTATRASARPACSRHWRADAQRYRGAVRVQTEKAVAERDAHHFFRRRARGLTAQDRQIALELRRAAFVTLAITSPRAWMGTWWLPTSVLGIGAPQSISAVHGQDAANSRRCWKTIPAWPADDTSAIRVAITAGRMSAADPGQPPAGRGTSSPGRSPAPPAIQSWCPSSAWRDFLLVDTAPLESRGRDRACQRGAYPAGDRRGARGRHGARCA